jgi:phosphoribosylglycinamide formyltransferase 1
MGRKLGILLSGSGRTLENLFERIDAKELDAEISLVISSRPDAFGLERARRRGVATAVVEGPSAAEASARIFTLLEAARVDAAVLAGYLKILEVKESWRGRILNIHPALLPAFGGKGMYGNRVHEAVLRSGARVSGCTVHYVTNDVDGGPIIEQRTVEVRDGDTLETLAARVFEAERAALPAALALHLAGKLAIRGLRVERLP